MKRSVSYYTLLRRNIKQFFNEAEIRDLCFELHVNYEDISGRNRSEKIRELILYFSRQDRITDLIQYCKQQRPHQDWGDETSIGVWEPLREQVENLGVMGKLAFNLLEKFIPDPPSVNQDFKKLQSQHESLSDDELAQLIVTSTAKKCGKVGFFTGIFGFYTVLLAVPTDIILSIKYEAEMAQLLAFTYDYTEDMIDFKAESLLVVIGEAVVGEILTTTISKSIVRSIPLLGAVIGYFLNYWAAKIIGQFAVYYYKGESPEELSGWLRFVRYFL